jgi:hypothetical protein
MLEAPMLETKKFGGVAYYHAVKRDSRYGTFYFKVIRLAKDGSDDRVVTSRVTATQEEAEALWAAWTSAGLP